MRPTVVVLSKASRRPLISKRGPKGFYKGTRQAHPPGIGFRTGPPGKHVIGGKAKYRLVDEQVRVFVAPPIQDILNCPLRPYVDPSFRLSTTQRKKPYGRMPKGGLTPAQFYEMAPRGLKTLEEIKTKEEGPVEQAMKRRQLDAR